MSDDAISDAENSVPQSIRINTSKQLFDIVSGTYKEQSDLDESVWRAMPFIAALFGIAVTVLRFVEPHFDFNGSAFGILSSLFYVVAIIAFILAFFFFWEAVRPRNFEYPSASIEIRDHVEALTVWHYEAGTADDKIDDQVVNDLRIFMIDQLSAANATNLELVRKRLSARSRTILLMLVGFAFVTASEMTIFIFKQVALTGA
jgi:hypothetical protein